MDQQNANKIIIIIMGFCADWLGYYSQHFERTYFDHLLSMEELFFLGSSTIQDEVFIKF
jgi:hypothetical protein